MKHLSILVVGLLMCLPAAAKPVNINAATAEVLAESLNGVGLKKAEAIVVYRKLHGNFKQASDLTKVKGIGLALLEKNKQDIQLKD